MELASGLSFPKIKRHRVVGNADHPVFVSSAELRPREIVGEDGFVGPALLGQRFGTPLAQAYAVAVAFRRDEEAAVLIPDGEAGAPQPQSPPEGCSGDGLAADGQRAA